MMMMTMHHRKKSPPWAGKPRADRLRKAVRRRRRPGRKAVLLLEWEIGEAMKGVLGGWLVCGVGDGVRSSD